MGRQLIQAALQMDGVALGAALEREGSSLLGSDAGELAGVGKTAVTVQSSLEVVKDDFDVFIDFTRPEGTLNHLAFCRQHGKGMVIGTTGFDDAGKQAIRDAAQDIGIVFAANFSVGVNVMLKLLEKAAKVMGDYTDIEIIEAHHRHKVDAPSGTALAMGEAIAHALDKDLKRMRRLQSRRLHRRTRAGNNWLCHRPRRGHCGRTYRYVCRYRRTCRNHSQSVQPYDFCQWCGEIGTLD